MTFSKASVVLTLTLLPFISYTQVVDPDMSVLENAETPGFVKELKPKVENPYSRNYYLASNWSMGHVDFKEGGAIDGPIKFDVVKNLIEYKKEEDIYLIPSYSVSSFSFYDMNTFGERTFTRADEFDYIETNALGFLEVLHKGTLSAYAHHEIAVYPASYSVSLSGSHRSNSIVWEEVYFVEKEGKVRLLSQKRKENQYLYDGKADMVWDYIKRNGLNYKRRNDIISIFEYYNSL